VHPPGRPPVRPTWPAPLRRLARLARIAGPALGAALLVGAGVYAADRPEGTLDRIRRERTVRVGWAWADPYAYRAPDGRVTGEAPEVARVVLEQLGVERIQWVQGELATLIPELRAGRFDLIATGMSVTEERARTVAFSRPTFVSAPALLVRAADAHRWTGYADLARDPSSILAVVAGTDAERRIRLAGIPAARLLRTPDVPTAVAAVQDGHATVLPLTAPILRRLVARMPGGDALRVVVMSEPAPPGGPPGRGAFAFRLGDEALRAAFDARLGALLGTPAHRALVAPFGLGTGDLPAPIPPAEAAR
jgi:polar amino acid transport system substrate-binding protein